jgi:hypothetical protein
LSIADGKIDYLVHSTRWALWFQEIALDKGVASYLKYPDHKPEKINDIWDFLARQGKRK